MKCKLLAKFVVTAFTLASVVDISYVARSQTPLESTTFSCGQDKATGQLATIAQKGATFATLIVWSNQSPYFGDKFTPANRCNIVTSKLNAAAIANGRSLQNLLLTNGIVNDEVVICLLNGGITACNSSNVLFSLKPVNPSQAGEILGQLLQFGNGNVAANGMQKSSSGQVSVNLGVWEAGVMGAASGR